MFKKGMSFLVIVAMMSLLASMVFAQDEEGVAAPLMDDFETEELFSTMDEFNNAIGHAEWGDAAGNVALGLAEIERDGEMTTALEISYDIGAWGGFTHALTDGENWVSQDWTGFNSLQFDFYGSNSGGIIQIEIFDNRNPELNNDTAERWFYRFDDNFEGWQTFTIPFEAFARRADFQPGGAPNDGFGLDAVSGYAFGMPAGVGANVAYLDNVTVVNAGVEPMMVSDFEVEDLFTGVDAADNGIGFVAWGDVTGEDLRLIDVARGSDDTRALAVDYDVTSFGGFSYLFNDGENWTPVDWTSYNGIEFWVLGSNTGEEIQFEIFDNLNPDAAGDSAERFFYRFVDDSFGWELIQIPFADFERRSDWQPGGALDDGFNLNAVSGYAFGLPVGTGSKVLVLDDMRLIQMDGVDMPEGVAVAAPAESEEEEAAPVVVVELAPVEPNPDFLGEMEYSDPLLVADYEDGVDIVDWDGTLIGFVPWGDNFGNAVIGITQVVPFTPLVQPEQGDGIEQVMRVEYNIASYGGYNHAFTDGSEPASQDWTDHNALQFWLYGNNTGGVVQVELFDNMAPDASSDSAERFYYQLVDDYEGWVQITIPFAFFQRRTDWQPANAPEDGLGLSEVHGYAIGFPGGVGEQVAYVDKVQVVVVENPAEVDLGDRTVVEEIEFVVDDSITWDSREWELMWSDEFDADAGTPVDDEFWSCDIGNISPVSGNGWGNNELQYYTCDTDNVAHDGDGNLVITAREEGVEEGRCYYGDCEYTSARILTQDKMEFTYGRVEARINIPEGQGIWSAFWMLGANFEEVGWPQTGEIDIMENVGNETNAIHGTIHGPGYSGGSAIGNSYYSDEAFTDDFHVYAVDWDPNVIRWYVDGELYGTLSVNVLMDASPWVFDNDAFLLLNVAVGGFWPGEPDETTEFPQEMIVDYVRVYQLTDDGTGG